MKKMIWPAATAALVLTVAGAAFAASAIEPTPRPTASESSNVQGDATIEEQLLAARESETDSGTSLGGKISTDDPDISEGFSMDPVLPTVTLFGDFNGNVFTGSIYVDATAASGPLENLTVQVILPLLLDDGSTFDVYDLPLQKTSLGIDNTQSIPVVFDLTTLVDRWSTEGTTVRKNGGDTLVASVSRQVEVSVHPSYQHPDAAIGLTGFTGPVKNLTRG